MSRRRGSILLGATVASMAAACTRPSRFDRYIAAQQWSDAALEFARDSALHDDEHALYRAGLLFSTPGRPTYDPARARELLTALINRFPDSSHRDEAAARILLLDEIVRVQRDSARFERELTGQVSNLTRETQALRVRADSSSALADSLRGVIARMEADRRDRESQLQALRRELQRLKEIDLKPRPATKP
jgi:hypothetical protein